MTVSFRLARGWQALAAALMLTANDARADDVRARCVASAELVQQLRDEHKLARAHAEAVRCAATECPKLIQRDCAEAIGEIARAQPSIAVRVKSSGADRADVRVLVDGIEVRARLDGAPLILDPGVHLLRLEAAGVTPVEQQIILVEGERNRVVDVVLEPLAAREELPHAPPREVSPSSSPPAVVIPPAAWAGAGVGVVGLAGFIYFGLSARGAISDLRGSCAPYCSADQISDVQTKRILADVSLGLGIIGVGAAAWLVIRANGVPPAARAAARSVAFDARAIRGGGALSIGGRF